MSARATWRPNLVASTAPPGNGSAGSASAGGTPLLRQPPTRRPRSSTGDHFASTVRVGDDQQKAPKTKTRRGGRRRGKHSKKQWGNKDKSLQSLLLSMLKLTLQNSQKNRMTMAATTDTVLADVDNSLVTAIKEEGVSFAAMVEFARKRLEEDPTAPPMSSVGAPTASTVIGFLEALAKADVGAVPRAAITAFLQEVQPESGDPTCSKEQLEQQFAFLRLEKMHDEAKIKIVIAMHGAPLRPMILAALRNMGLDVRTGMAPPGWMEEELSTWVDALAL